MLFHSLMVLLASKEQINDTNICRMAIYCRTYWQN